MKKNVFTLLILLTVGTFASVDCLAQVNPFSGNVVIADDVDYTKFNKKTVEKINSRVISQSGYKANHEYVDMGTEVLWATMNVNANYPWETGKYFMWGGITGDSQIFSPQKSLTFERASIRENQIMSNGAYDAAAALWKNGWRLPTYKDIKELMDVCEKKWVEIEGKNIQGCLLISKKTHNTLFLPAAGTVTNINKEINFRTTDRYGHYSGVGDININGTYWTCTPYVPNVNNTGTSAYTLDISINHDKFICVSWTYRYRGCSIRPVIPKTGNAPELTGKAKKYYDKAISGDVKAMNNLGACYYIGESVTKDYAQAVYWFRKAVEKGSPIAHFNLGFCYYNGHGVNKDYNQAAKLFRSGAEKGEVKAQHMLAQCYYNGTGVTKDIKQAVAWANKAAEQGYADSQYSMGWFYENGVGVKKDKNKANEWYRKAARQKNSKAKDKLKKQGLSW